MSNRQEYEADAINRITAPFRRKPGISDSARDNEHESQRHFYAAAIGFKDIVKQCAALSNIQRDNFNDLLVVLDDYTPDENAWDEKIAEARRGD